MKTRLLRHFILKMIILPRRARDKHKGNSQKGCVVLQSALIQIGAINATGEYGEGDAGYAAYQPIVQFDHGDLWLQHGAKLN
jgi:hypothetical protein